MSKRVIRNNMLWKKIEQIYHNTKGRYGSPRITKELTRQGTKASEVLVAKLMRQHGLRSIVKMRYKVTTDSAHKYPVVKNILNREFTVEKENTVWVSDITYIATNQGWLYITTVIDLSDRKVIGWSMSETMKTKDTTLAAFKMAKLHHPIHPHQRLIFHSYIGVQYACDEFVNELNKHKNIIRSMSRKGNCWDNAVSESFFKTLKTELVYHHKYETKQQAQLSIFQYIEAFYNTTRRHSHLNNLTILEFQQLINNNLKHVA
jgi:putative transposase